jgi:hypothetical protein
MSWIAGAVDFAGLRASAEQLERISAAGFGGANRPWLDNLASLISTPGQPVHNPEAGLVLVMDGRLDGARELASACAAAGHPPRGESATELVTRAYQTWGDRCPLHILGEYAFAIWDRTRQRLFCARDSGGIRPLFYAVLPDGSFRFATNALQILAGTDVSRMPDEAGLVDFLISRSALLPDRSPWRSVQRLGAAQALTLDRSGLRVSRYWSVYEAPEVRFSSQDEAVRACSTALQEAIRDRVAGADRAGISLSGGWDSGAAFAVWQSMRRDDPTLPEPWFYTYYSDSPEADERAEVRDLVRCWPATGEFVHLDADGLLDGLDRHCMQLGMPEPASGWRWVGECAAAARAAGVSRVLVGEAGNEVLQSSIMRPADLLRSGRARDAYRQVRAWGRDTEASVRSFLWPFVVWPALTSWFPGIWDVARYARGVFGMRSGALPYLTDSSQELALDLICQANARNRHRLKGRTVSLWDKRVSLDRWCSELFPIPAGPELQGVALTAPYLDRRVVTSALAALDCESRAGSTRRLLASIVQFTTGRPFHGRHAHYTGLLDMALRSAMQTSGDLFSASRLVELEVVDPGRLKGFVDCFRSRNGASLTSLWRLISAEVWARLFMR